MHFSRLDCKHAKKMVINKTRGLEPDGVQMDYGAYSSFVSRLSMALASPRTTIEIIAAKIQTIRASVIQ